MHTVARILSRFTIKCEARPLRRHSENWERSLVEAPFHWLCFILFYIWRWKAGGCLVEWHTALSATAESVLISKQRLNMFVIWGLNQNADKEWIRGLVGEASHGWVQRWMGSKNTKAAPSSYSSEAEEYQRVDQAQGWCLLSNVLPFWRSREQQQSLFWPGYSLLPTTHSAVHSCHICHSNSLSSRWTHNLSPQLTRFWPSLSLKRYHLCVFLFLTKSVIHSFMLPHLTSPHDTQVLEHHKRKKTEDLCDLRGYTLLECFSWMSWLLWSMEARGHFGLCTPELLEDQV